MKNAFQGHNFTFFRLRNVTITVFRARVFSVHSTNGVVAQVFRVGAKNDRARDCIEGK